MNRIGEFTVYRKHTNKKKTIMKPRNTRETSATPDRSQRETYTMCTGRTFLL